MGMINNNKYCLKNDAFQYENPSNIFENMNFLTDYNEDGLARKLVMKKIGYDVLPDNISKDMNQSLWNKVYFFI